MSIRSPFDPGLQVERTFLAWQRTCLAVALVNAVLLRVSAPTDGVLLTLGLLGLVGALAGGLWSALRYEGINQTLASHGRVPRVVFSAIAVTAACLGCAVVSVFFMVEWTHA